MWFGTWFVIVTMRPTKFEIPHGRPIETRISDPLAEGRRQIEHARERTQIDKVGCSGKISDDSGMRFTVGKPSLYA